MYRQGDVLIVAVAVDELPAAAHADSHWDGVLVHGEVTGHAHRIADRTGVELRRDGEAMYLVLSAPATVTHEEHGTIPLAPGAYQVIRQRVYEPEAIQYVRD